MRSVSQNSGYLLPIAVSIVLVVIGDSLILQRELNGPTRYLTIRGDTKRFYVSFLKFCMPKTTLSPDVAVVL